MTTPAAGRKPIAHAVIGLGLLVGVHMLAVEPAAKRLASARAELARRDTDAATLRAVQSALPAIQAASQRCGAEAAAIDAAGAPARDPGALFAGLAALADRHRVRVEQLDPFEPPQPAAAPPADPAAPAPPRDTRLGYTMTLNASYADLAAFLDAVQHGLGFVRITSVRITPAGEGDRVSARVQTVHYSFELPAPPAPPISDGPKEGAP